VIGVMRTADCYHRWSLPRAEYHDVLHATSLNIKKTRLVLNGIAYVVAYI